MGHIRDIVIKRPTIICLTPVKNEAWILERFLKCASLWADHIIIADQSSDDGSIEIARKFPKVKLINNPSPDFNEPKRQKMLIDAAREFDSPRLLITLDADELLTPNFDQDHEWESVLRAPMGTVIRFKWANIKPDMKGFWSPACEFAWGFMDDGSAHSGQQIHSPRVPVPKNAPSITLQNIKVMHYQYTDWGRMLSKHRWYQCWERINNPDRSAISIYRQYHHMDAVPKSDIHPIPQWWFENYVKYGIDVVTFPRHLSYRWDKEIIEYIARFGAAKFSREFIWDMDWKQIATHLGYGSDALQIFNDPRGLREKMMHKWLKVTQPHANTPLIGIIDKFLSCVY